MVPNYVKWAPSSNILSVKTKVGVVKTDPGAVFIQSVKFFSVYIRLCGALERCHQHSLNYD